MTQIQISTEKIKKLRDKMKRDPMYKNIDFRYDADVVNRLCDAYLQQDRDRIFARHIVDEFVEHGIIRPL